MPSSSSGRNLPRLDSTVEQTGIPNAAGKADSNDAPRTASDAVLDATPPTATITLGKSLLATAGSPSGTYVIVEFNEAVSGTLTTNDFSCATAAVSELTRVNDRTWSAYLTPTAGTSSPSNTLSLNISGIRDQAGNRGAAAPVTATFATDSTRPTLNSIALSRTSLHAGQSASVTFSFSEALGSDGLTVANVSAPHATLSNLASNDGGITWTATLTPENDTQSESNAITVRLAGVHDAAGNYGIGEGAASANYSVDTRVPTFGDATVNCDQLVINFYAYLDAEHPPAAGAFTVLVDGLARAVSAVAVHSNAVTLTLASAVARGQSVTVGYTDPTAGDDANAVQSTVGSDAPSFSNKAVYVRTDATAPVFSSAAVNGDQLKIYFNVSGERLNAEHPPAAGAFTVLVDGVARAVSAVAVDANATSVTLTLASAVAPGQTVTVGYTDPTAGNDANAVQNTWGSDAPSFSNMEVRNNSAAPVLSRATVHGDQLVLTWTEVDRLDTNTAAASAFVVTADGAAVAVNSVVVNANIITLTLASPVTGSQTVRVSYTDPNPTRDDSSGVVQDRNGNDAASFSDRLVTNVTLDTTPPTATITLRDSLLATAGSPEEAYVTIEFNEVVNGTLTANDFSCATGTVSSVYRVDDRTWRAYLTPTAGTSSPSNTLSLNISGMRDDAGNSGAAAPVTATFATDGTRPTLNSIALSRTTLRAGQTATVTFTFSESLGSDGFPVSSVIAPNATLSNLASTDGGTTWTATLTPSDNTLSESNAITVRLASDSAYFNFLYGGVHDAAGNIGIGTSAASANYSVDTRSPSCDMTAVSGDQLILYFDWYIYSAEWHRELVLDTGHPPAAGAFTVLVDGLARAVSAVAVDANTVTLTLASAVTLGQTVTVSYTDPTDGDDANAIQNTLGNDASSFSNVEVSTDSTAPVLTSAWVNGSELVLYYYESRSLDINHTISASAFAVTVDGVAVTVNSAVAYSEEIHHNVTLTLARAVTAGQTVRVSYTDPNPTLNDSSGVVQDRGGNDAASFSDHAVTNDTPDPAAPTLEISVAYAGGASLVRTGAAATVTFAFSKVVSGFTLADDVSISYGQGALSNLQTADGGKTWTATLTPPVNSQGSANIYVSMSGVRDAAGNHPGSETVSASYSFDTRRPGATIHLDDTLLASAALSPVQSTTITVTFDQAVTGTLTAGDFSSAHATVSAVHQVSDTVWTATLTPIAGTTVRNSTIRLNITGMHDRDGNAGTDNAPETSFSTDASRPTLSSIELGSQSLRAGQTTSVRFTFSEAVSHFDATDVTAPGCTLTGLTSSADAITWTATLTPNTNTESAGNAITVNLAGIHDTTGNAGVGTSTASSSYSVDTLAPELSGAPTVNGNQLVLTYNQALDDAHPPAAGAFRLR